MLLKTLKRLIKHLPNSTIVKVNGNDIDINLSENELGKLTLDIKLITKVDS